MENKKGCLSIVAVVLAAVIGITSIVHVVQKVHHNNLQETVWDFESRFTEIIEASEIDLDETDTVGLKEQKANAEQLHLEVLEVIKDSNDEEELMFKEFEIMLTYYIEAIDIMVATIENPLDLLTGSPLMRLEAINNEIDKHGQLYNQYKKALELECIEDELIEEL
jgi:hypothetical protein